MKKWIAFLLAVTMLAALTGCGQKAPAETTAAPTTEAPTTEAPTTEAPTTETPTTEAPTTEAPTTEAAPEGSALAILNALWDKISADKMWDEMGGVCPIIGGDYSEENSNIVDNAPGKFDVNNTDALAYLLCVPESEFDKITDCANLSHMRNTNTLTIAVFKLSDGTGFGEAMKDALVNNQWLCGFPQKVMVISLDDNTFVTAYGMEEVLDKLPGMLTELHGSGVTVVCDEPIR